MSAKETSPNSSSSQLIHGLQQFLYSCSKAVEDGDFHQSEASISELVESISSIYDASISSPDDEETQINSITVLSHINSYLSNPSLDQAVIDALSFELPKAVATFAGMSQRCSELVISIIDVFVTKCSARDMISVFSEALDSYGKTTDAAGYVAVFLHEVSKVFLSIQRRHFEQIKVALPIILNALKTASFDLDDCDVGVDKLFEGAVAVAGSIQATCKKLEGEASSNLQSLLVLYVLQVMALASITMGTRESMCLSFALQLSSVFPYCGLLYADLITGHGIDPLISRVCDGDTDDYMDCFSYVKHGAVLSVIWGHISDEVVQAARQDLHILKDELRSTRSSRWSAVGSMKFVFALGNLPWSLKKHALDFLLGITENDDQQEMSEDMLCSLDTLSLISTLQAITSLIMTAPSAEPRKMAFATLKSVLADFPASLRLDTMQFLVKNSSSASMTAILLDFVRENLRNDYLKLKEAKICTTNSFWNAAILDLVEFILRPPCGGPPSLPDQIDAVLSALNLFRYILITESTGKTNHTGVLSKTNLQKVYNEMLLPLQTVVTAVMSDTKSDGEQHGFDIMCALNPVEFVLYRCIELVEDNIKQPV
ncbi:aberrant root formation protein 4 [Silene latifolia]|uniref:aberrant root formation protein 4 n=1 Tax=Silene latifolia TaxID=37657 RepID=UPI003D76E44E